MKKENFKEVDKETMENEEAFEEEIDDCNEYIQREQKIQTIKKWARRLGWGALAVTVMVVGALIINGENVDASDVLDSKDDEPLPLDLSDITKDLSED